MPIDPFQMIIVSSDHSSLTSSLPTVSVVVPAKNEGRHIGACLRSLKKEAYPSHLIEVLVVDNGSTDDTAVIASAAGARVISLPDGLVGAVRNAGARLASGEILAFLDADCVTNGRWLSSTIGQLSAPGVGAAGGGYLASRDDGWVQLAWAAVEPRPTADVSALPGGSLVMRRSTFDEIGGFNEQLSAGEDDEICRRVNRLGLRIIADANAAVVHLGYPSTLRAVARRQIWHGSHQLDVATSWREPQLLLTHSFAVGVVLLPALLLSREVLPLAISGVLAAIAVPVVIMATSKARHRKNAVRTFLQMLPVAIVFYAGRAVGLVQNYWTAIRSCWQRIVGTSGL